MTLPGAKSHQRALPKRIENFTEPVSPLHEANEENPGRLQAQAPLRQTPDSVGAAALMPPGRSNQSPTA